MIFQNKNCWLFFAQSGKCLLCSQNHRNSLPICSGCRNDLPWLQQNCQRCALPLALSAININARNLICAQCQKKSPVYDRVSAAFSYQFPINLMIMQAKFNNKVHYLNLLTQLLLTRLDTSTSPDALIPVPMHRQRLLQRQFNQAAIISRCLSHHTGIPSNYYLLEKSCNTEHQMQLDAAQRQRNLRNSFSCRQAPPKHVAVIDDVVTTGTTANEIARTLKRAGCGRVDIWSLARTPKEY